MNTKKNKKMTGIPAILILCLLLMGLFPLNAMAAGDAHVIVDTITGPINAGDEVTVPVRLTNNPGIAGAGFEIFFDASVLTLTNFTAGTVLPNMTKNVPGHKLNFWTTENVTSDGVVFNAIFEVNATAPTGDYEVSIGLVGGLGANFVNEDLDAVPVDFTVGTISVLGTSTSPALVTVGSLSAQAGATNVAVPVTIEDNPGIAAAAFTLSYDTTALTLTGFTNGGVFEDSQLSQNVATKSVAFLSLTEDKTADGVLFNAIFDVNATAPLGSYTVGIGLVDGLSANFVNYDADEVAVSFTAGSVRVKGDAAYDLSLVPTGGKTHYNVGEEIEVSLVIEGSEDIYGAQAEILFVPAVLSYTSSSNAVTGGSAAEVGTTGLIKTSFTNPQYGYAITAETPLTLIKLQFTVKDTIAAGNLAESLRFDDNNTYTYIWNTEDEEDNEVDVNTESFDFNAHNIRITFKAPAEHGTLNPAAPVYAYAKYGVAGLYTANDYATTFVFPAIVPETSYRAEASPWTNDGGTTNKTEAEIALIAFTANTDYTARVTLLTYTGVVRFIENGGYKAAPQGYKILVFTPDDPKASLDAENVHYTYNGEAMYWSSKYLDEDGDGDGSYLFFVLDTETAANALTLITTAAGADAANHVVQYDGDVNGDSTTNTFDATIAGSLWQGRYLTSTTLSALSRFEADVNGDGYVDLTDVTRIQAIYLGI
ncbi:MAG: dockerin type I domain-containing protein [Clostridiales Family XIII bacterium]|jgi:hypothetical protein|nr:dockerin type I domain-containing protein [Clostridiales Family XIII bacterium]